MAAIDRSSDKEMFSGPENNNSVALKRVNYASYGNRQENWPMSSTYCRVVTLVTQMERIVTSHLCQLSKDEK